MLAAWLRWQQAKKQGMAMVRRERKGWVNCWVNWKSAIYATAIVDWFVLIHAIQNDTIFFYFYNLCFSRAKCKMVKHICCRPIFFICVQCASVTPEMPLLHTTDSRGHFTVCWSITVTSHAVGWERSFTEVAAEPARYNDTSQWLAWIAAKCRDSINSR